MTASKFVGQSRFDRIAYAVFRTALCGFTRIFTRLTIEGTENLPTTGAYVLAPVHRSYVDTPITACVTRRRIRFMGKQEVWETPWAGWLASTLGAFPVARGKADREALLRCIATLQGGEPLVLFPEGERKDGLVVQPLFDGAAYVAAKAGVPIIPIGIGGSARVMPRHAKMIHPVKVCVVIGKPIYAEVGTSGRASRAAIAAVTAQLSHDLQQAFDRAEARSRKLPVPPDPAPVRASPPPNER
jgi:1-acyl-sn-glycerol-3-phosphate acyltransferase